MSVRHQNSLQRAIFVPIFHFSLFELYNRLIPMMIKNPSANNYFLLLLVAFISRSSIFYVVPKFDRVTKILPKDLFTLSPITQIQPTLLFMNST